MENEARKVTDEEWRHYAEMVRNKCRFLESVGYRGHEESHRSSTVLGDWRTIEYTSPSIKRSLSFRLIRPMDTNGLFAGLTIFKVPFSSWLNDKILIRKYMTHKGLLSEEYECLPVEEMVARFAKVLQEDLNDVVRGKEWFEGYGDWGPFA